VEEVFLQLSHLGHFWVLGLDHWLFQHQSHVLLKFVHLRTVHQPELIQKVVTELQVGDTDIFTKGLEAYGSKVCNVGDDTLVDLLIAPPARYEIQMSVTNTYFVKASQVRW